jgi:phosphotransferase system  glucose/maltose/N-acetylglucosamine-specific IIC component
MKPITQVTHLFNVAKKGISYGKVVRSVLFLLLVITIGLSAKESPLNSSLVALIAFVAFDVICFFRSKENKVQTNQIQEIVARMEEVEKASREIKNDLSVAKISTVIGNSKRR